MNTKIGINFEIAKLSFNKPENSRAYRQFSYLCDMKIIKYFFLLFIAFASCKGRQNVGDYNSLEKSYLSTILQKRLALNKQIIPYLIDSIDIERTSFFIGFRNPTSSFIGSYHMNNQKGILDAYCIDFILSKDSIETVEKILSDDDYLTRWQKQIEPYRIYGLGVIVKQDENDKPILEPLTHEDMVIIKKMYLDWWEKNKEKPIETLREEFKNGNKILQLPYIWI